MSSNDEKNPEKALLALLEAEVKQKKHYGALKGAWLKSMKAMSSPFANYNKNVQGYLEDPELHEFNKQVIKLKTFCEKLYGNKKALTNISKIPKNLSKLYRLTTEIVNHPVYSNKRYENSMNVEGVLKEGERLNDCLSNLAEQFKIHNPLPSEGDWL